MPGRREKLFIPCGLVSLGLRARHHGTGVFQTQVTPHKRLGGRNGVWLTLRRASGLTQGWGGVGWFTLREQKEIHLRSVG